MVFRCLVLILLTIIAVVAVLMFIGLFGWPA